MSKVLISSLSIALLFAATGCKRSDDSTDSMKMSGGSSTSASTPATMTYTCTMHPKVISDKPGKCPKCEMELVAKK